MMLQKNNLKIIYIDASPILNERISGIGHLTLKTIQELVKNDARFDVKLMVPIAKMSYIKYWGLENIGIVKIPLPSRVWNKIPSLPAMFPIDLFLKKGIFIFPNFRAWPLKRSKSITYIHDISFELFPAFTEVKNLDMLKKNVPRWIANSDRIITDSESSKNEIVDHYGLSPQNIKSIYCGVDGGDFKPINKRLVSSTLARYKIERPYIVFLSSLEPRKNVERMLDSLLLLPESVKEKQAVLLIGGMGWRNENIYKKIDILRRKGWMLIKPESYVPDEDIPALLTGASFLLHPTLHEGFGIPVVEAMSCGTPVITSDIAVMHEVCGEAAIFVDPYKPRAIADAIINLLDNPTLSKRMRRLGVKRAKLFTWKKSIDQLVIEIEAINKGIIV